MTLQHSRRRDPYPWTWEIPALATMLVVLLLAVGVQLGRTGANLVAVGVWTWPAGQASFWSSIVPVLSGDPGAGLTASSADDVRTDQIALWCGIAVVEAVFLIGTTALAAWALRRWGPGRMRGMASRAEAEALLGLTRLRRVAPIVRPDVHGKTFSKESS